MRGQPAAVEQRAAQPGAERQHQLAPRPGDHPGTVHLEMSQAPVRWGMSYDTYIGEHERRRLGDALWSRRVRNVVEGLRPVFLWDRLYLGGGNSRLITPAQLARMGDDVVVVPNTAGIVGGVRAWTLGVNPLR